MNQIGPGIIAIIGAVVTLAIVAVIVSKNAQTSSVITGAGTALSSVIGAAVQPISGTQANNFGSNGTT